MISLSLSRHDTQKSLSAFDSDSIHSMDIEGLLSSYDPFIHPAHFDKIYERHSALLAAQFEAGFPGLGNDDEGVRPGASSGRSIRSGLDLPIATSQPVRPSTAMSRKLSSASSFTSRKCAAGRTWLSGELPLESGTDSTSPGESSVGMTRKPSNVSTAGQTVSAPGVKHMASQSNTATSGLLQRSLSMQSTQSATSIGQMDSSPSSQAQSPSQSRQTVSQRSVPSRFTFARRQSDDRVPDQAKPTIYSPRSSTSSQPASFRWSTSSRDTASTACSSRKSSQQTPKPVLEVFESATHPSSTSQDDYRASAATHARRPSGSGHRKDQASIDSLDSLAFEPISAKDFPTPPLSRRPSEQTSYFGMTRPESSEGLAHPLARQSSNDGSLRSESKTILPVHTSAPLSRELSSGSARRAQGTGVLNMAILNASLARSGRPSEHV